MESSIKPFILDILALEAFKGNSVKVVDKLIVADYRDKNTVASAKDYQDKRIEAYIGEYIAKSNYNNVLCDYTGYNIQAEHESWGNITQEVSFFCFSEQQLILFCEELLKAVLSGRHYSKPISYTVKGEWDENDLV